jgi:hypothetical protein
MKNRPRGRFNKSWVYGVKHRVQLCPNLCGKLKNKCAYCQIRVIILQKNIRAKCKFKEKYFMKQKWAQKPYWAL